MLLHGSLDPADFFAPREYRLVINATIHNVRNCLPPITLPITFMHTMPAHRAYLDNPVEAKLMPLLPWRTVPASQADAEMNRV